MCSFIPVVTARDAFAPSWLKEGAYVKYEPSQEGNSGLGFVGFFDLSNPNFTGTNYMMLGHPVDAVIETISSSLVWRCVSVNSTMAKLQVTLDYVGKLSQGEFEENSDWIIGPPERASIQRTVEVYVDLYTRGVYNVDGVFLGTTHLWLPANPSNGQKITIWEENSEPVTVSVTIFEGKSNRDGFQIGTSTVTIKNGPKAVGSLFYELNTGLGWSCVGGGYFSWDPIFAAVGIQGGSVGKATETNIDLGSERSEINWMLMLYYAIIPVAIILLVATLVIKRRKKRP